MRIPQLGILRFLAAALVVVFHYGYDTFLADIPVLDQVVRHGSQAVNFFFVLSGFVLAHVYIRYQGSWQAFMNKRVARILPLYWFGIATVLLLGLTLVDNQPKGSTIILHALGLQAWVPGQSLSVNFPGWSICVEFLFYALFPALLMLYRRRGIKTFALFSIVVWGGLQLLHYNMKESGTMYFEENDQFILYFPLFHLGTFLIGMIGGFLFNLTRPSINPNYTALAALGIILAAMQSDYYMHY